jgi:hypothetical protein
MVISGADTVAEKLAAGARLSERPREASTACAITGADAPKKTVEFFQSTGR